MSLCAGKKYRQECLRKTHCAVTIACRVLAYRCCYITSHGSRRPIKKRPGAVRPTTEMSSYVFLSRRFGTFSKTSPFLSVPRYVMSASHVHARGSFWVCCPCYRVFLWVLSMLGGLFGCVVQGVFMDDVTFVLYFCTIMYGM